MNALIIGLYGLFLMFVGFAGNFPKLAEATAQDGPPFLQWAFAIGVLAVLYEYPETRKIATPFIVLAVLGFILSNYDRLQSEYARLIEFSKGK